MIISEFYDYVRTLTRANSRDLPDTEIAILANPEADYLYEISIQAYHLEQTKNQTPTVITYTKTGDFEPTDHNLWIERVEYAADGENYCQLKRTNKTEYLAMGCKCDSGSLTNDLISENCTNYFIQTSQGIHVFPAGNSSGGTVKIYIKDTPVIDWSDDNYEILLPNVPINLLALKTALMYRDINDTNLLTFLQGEYAAKFQTFEKRLAQGGRSIQMHQVTKTII